MVRSVSALGCESSGRSQVRCLSLPILQSGQGQVGGKENLCGVGNESQLPRGVALQGMLVPLGNIFRNKSDLIMHRGQDQVTEHLWGFRPWTQEAEGFPATGPAEWCVRVKGDTACPFPLGFRLRSLTLCPGPVRAPDAWPTPSAGGFARRLSGAPWWRLRPGCGGAGLTSAQGEMHNPLLRWRLPGPGAAGPRRGGLAPLCVTPDLFRQAGRAQVTH